jgi:hypothetical protein
VPTTAQPVDTVMLISNNAMHYASSHPDKQFA